jgi:hypothetical protein
MPPSLEINGSSIISYSDFDTSAKQAHIVFGDASGVPFIKMAGNTAEAVVRVTNLAAPEGITDAVNKEYVDAAINGLHIKAPVRYGSFNNVSIATNLLVGERFDPADEGTTLVLGNRVLLMGQTNAIENGVWEITAGAAVRPADFVTDSFATGVYVFVDEGALLDRAYICITNESVSQVGTNALEWVQFSARPLALAGNGLVVGAGENTLNVDSTLVPYLDNNQTFTGDNTFTGAITATSITGLSTPLATETTKAATVGFVNQQFSGFSYKSPVAVASTEDIPLTTLQVDLVVDGYTLLANDRVLLKDQTDATENGLYVVGEMSRATDLPLNSSAYGLFVVAVNGTVNGDQAFVCTDAEAVAVVNGTNALHFSPLVTQSIGLAGNGLVHNGTALDVQVDDSTIEITADTLQIKDAGITDAKIAAGAISNAKLTNSSVSITTQHGVIAPESVSLGGTMDLSIDYAVIPGIAETNTFTGGNTFTGVNQYNGNNTFTSGVTINSGTASTSQATGALVITGGVGISGNVFCNSSYNMSDMRLKDNIESIEEALDIVNKMRGCTFTWNEQEANKECGRVGVKTVGVIAQEVQEAGAPLCVIHNQDTDLLAVDYTKIVPYLIESVRTLKRKCEAVEDKYEALSTELRVVRAKLA